MGKQNSKKLYLIILSLVAFIFFITAIVSTFYTSKAGEIKREQIKLIKENQALKQSIEEKKEQFTLVQDKIEDIKELISEDNGQQNSDVDKLIKTLSKRSKKLIIDSIPSGYPLDSKRITSEFGYRIHPIHGTKKFHHGLDFGGKIGTSIVATADGIVEFSGFDKGYGNLVVIHHNFGFKTAYGHMLKNLKVKKGDFIKKGDVLGHLGSTGISTGPHLHYEIKYIKYVLNPKNFLNFSINNFDETLFATNRIGWYGLVSAIMNQYGRISLARLL